MKPGRLPFSFASVTRKGYSEERMSARGFSFLLEVYARMEMIQHRSLRPCFSHSILESIILDVSIFILLLKLEPSASLPNQSLRSEYEHTGSSHFNLQTLVLRVRDTRGPVWSSCFGGVTWVCCRRSVKLSVWFLGGKERKQMVTWSMLSPAL